jgi:carbon storage regulator
MLVLSRKENESIKIGDSITVKVVAIRGNKVRLAIDAPPEVPVDREEVRRRIDQEQRPQRAIILWSPPVSGGVTSIVGPVEPPAPLAS